MCQLSSRPQPAIRLCLSVPSAATGAALLCGQPADSEWNNWPAMPNFVPLINETLYYLKRARDAERKAAQCPRRLGNHMERAGRTGCAVGRRHTSRWIDQARPALFRNGHWEFQYPNTFLPGLYQLRFARPAFHNRFFTASESIAANWRHPPSQNRIADGSAIII